MNEIRVGFGFDVHPFESNEISLDQSIVSIPVGGEQKDTPATGVTAVDPGTKIAGGLLSGDKPCLVLGGVKFSEVPPLRGHSDADVLAHALSDALLGAAAMGDIGMMFPDDDNRFYKADSLWMLSEVSARIARDGWSLTNADCSIVTEYPKLSPTITEMTEKLSAAANGPIHVKATRPEKLGSLGRGEGIACFAVVLIARR